MSSIFIKKTNLIPDYRNLLAIACFVNPSDHRIHLMLYADDVQKNFHEFTKTFDKFINRSIKEEKEDFSFEINSILEDIRNLHQKLNSRKLEIFFHNMRKLMNYCAL